MQDNESVTDVDSTSAVVEEADSVISTERNDALKPMIVCVIIDCSSMMFIDCVGTMTIEQVFACHFLVQRDCLVLSSVGHGFKSQPHTTA